MKRRSRRRPVALLCAFVAAMLCLVPGAAHAAPFTVDSTADSGDGSPGDGACGPPCTLRAAVQESNGHSGDDVINLPAGTYQLTGAAGDDADVSGDLDVNDVVSSGSLTIVGAGARTTRIVGTGTDRVIHLLNAQTTTSISGVTITGGGGIQQGGGVFAVGTFNLTDAVVTGNRVEDQSSNNQGGGIFNSNLMNLVNVTVSGNVGVRGSSSSFGPQGGGIFDNGTPTSTLTNVTISGNSLTGSGSQGGGMFYNANANSTTLRNVTIAGNTVSGVNGQAGGFFVNDEVAFANTIVAGNQVNGAASNCVDSTTTPKLHSQGGNLEGGTDCGFTAGTDKRNADPLLGALADNGGQTDTMALGAGSPAIDAAIGCPPPATDQRGLARPQLGACDIGAFEFAPPVLPVAPPAGLPAPKLGRSMNVAVVRGRVFVSLPGNAAFASLAVPGLKGRRFVPLTVARQIPMGSLLDTRRGTVSVTTARDASGSKLQSGEFLAGVFAVLQSRRASAKGLTDLPLKGSSFRSCIARKGKRASAALSRRVIRRLRARANGRFRTRGRYSAATVRGTEWETIDRCDGTLTKVKRGVVVVRDNRKRRNITVRAGKSYLARAPG